MMASQELKPCGTDMCSDGRPTECPRTSTSRPRHKELEYMVNVVSCLSEGKINYLVSDVGSVREPCREKMTQPPAISQGEFQIECRGKI